MNLTSLSFIMYFVVLMVVMCILQLLMKVERECKDNSIVIASYI